jgi:para-aminobenzoate synthetase / 4-amino-4-deoxychorismate lyase
MSCTPFNLSAPLVVLRDEVSGRWLRFQHPVEVVAATRLEEVLPGLRKIEHAATERGLHAAGWVSYEAAPAFDPALAVRASGDFPLLWFGLYADPEPIDLPPATDSLPAGWHPDLAPDAYARAFDRIKAHIRAGDTYQVNFSHRLLREAFALDPWQAFLALVAAQRAPFGAYAAAGPFRLCSASPELFFRLDGSRIESRPMKGTAPRGLSAAQDRALAAALLASEKNRAENLMIVDMVRNDLGRIARPGSVQTTRSAAWKNIPPSGN